jgi:hypothetical protein
MLRPSLKHQDITVTVKDTDGEPMSGVTVELEAGGYGTVVKTALSVTDANGKATVSERFRFMSGTRATFEVTATDSQGNEQIFAVVKT